MVGSKVANNTQEVFATLVTLQMCVRVKLALARVTDELLARARNAVPVPAARLVVH